MDLNPSTDYAPLSATAEAEGHLMITIGVGPMPGLGNTYKSVTRPKTRLHGTQVIQAINAASDCNEEFSSAQAAWRWLRTRIQAPKTSSSKAA